jgi:hypothetical protein
MTARPTPKRHWRSYGHDPLPTREQALDETLRAFPSWFLRIVCDRCGKERLISETYLVRSATSSRGCVTTAAAVVARGGWSC